MNQNLNCFGSEIKFIVKNIIINLEINKYKLIFIDKYHQLNIIEFRKC